MSTNKNLITIGIPFYNDEKYLDLAIKSVFAQTYTDWKLILMDDGSTDKSLEIAKKYKDDHRVTIYSDGENRQLPFRLNQIASLTTTKYLARMDSDDIMHPKRIQTQIKILEDNPEIDVLGTNAYSIDADNQINGIKRKINLEETILVSCTSFIHPSIMGKTEWFIKNPYDLKSLRIEDTELWYRTAKTSTFRLYTFPLLFYREFGADYYKKYANGLKGSLYVLNKNKNTHWIIYFISKCFKMSMYWAFGKLGVEQKLIANRICILPTKLVKEAEIILGYTIKNYTKDIDKINE